MSEIEKIAKQILGKGKGILAADESTGTMSKRLSSVNIESTSENRLRFRETLFSAKGMEAHIGGVILYDETIKQKTSSGKTIPELIKSFGTIPGIKVDTGAKKLAGSPEEKITEGLDGLRERLASINVESTGKNRLRFRETLFSAEGMKNYIGGVILYDETIKQKTSSGKTIPELIKSFGSIPGIKVDTGLKKLTESSVEKFTSGLEGLKERLTE